jgi:hypothetical protein
MSELSTVAIKDGHRGHLSHNHHNPMDAERADRISRLAGFDRVGGHPPRNVTPGSNAGSFNATPGQQAVASAYFDANNAPQITRERSTVGSASATGSAGGRTTWASGSDVYDPDKMSEDINMQDGEVDNSSMGGFSDDGAGTSLVGFGEGARTPARQLSSFISPNNPIAAKPPSMTAAGTRTLPQVHQQQQEQTGASTPQSVIEAQKQHAKMIGGMTYDKDVVDTVNRTPPLVEP